MEGHCDIHDVQMKEIDGKYGKFWSHETDDERYKKVGKNDIRYCNGKLPESTKEVKNIEAPKEQIRCKIWEIAWRVFPSDPEARNQCIKQGESFIFSGELANAEKFEYEGEQ